MRLGWRIECGPLREDEGNGRGYTASTIGSATHLFLKNSDPCDEAQLQLLATLGEAAGDYMHRVDNTGRAEYTDMDDSQSFYIELTEIEITDDMLTPIEDWPEE